MSKEKKLVPKLRFEEFKNSNIWTKNPLTSLVNGIDTGKSSFNSRLVNSIEKPYPILGSRGIIGYDNTYDYEGSFILTARVGENAGNLYKHSGKVKISDNTVYLEAERLNFVYYLLANYDLKKLSFGTGQPLIKASEIRDLNLNMPIEVKEQNKVGSFFEQIDEIIQLQQSKVNKVKDLKSAYLSELFPKEGKKYPKKRFEGFTEPWTAKKLGSLLDYEQPTNYLVKSDSYDDSYLTPVLTAGKSFLLGYTNETEGIYKADNNNGVIIFDDFTTSSHFVDFDFKVKSSAMKFLRTNQSNFNLYFLYNLLTSINYSPESHERHWISIFSEFEVLVPTKKEQEKIAQLFKNLDNQISIEEEKLSKLEKLKQAYLNDMFV